jgi:hypothetical protein
MLWSNTIKLGTYNLIIFFSDAFKVNVFRIFWAHHFGLGYYRIMFLAMPFRPGLIGLAIARLSLANQALRIPIAFLFLG